jgi:hypothetical protein
MVGMKVLLVFFVVTLLLQDKQRLGFICVGKHYILYCAIHYYRKKNVSVGKVGALKKNVFSSLRVLLPFFR